MSQLRCTAYKQKRPAGAVAAHIFSSESIRPWVQFPGRAFNRLNSDGVQAIGTFFCP